MPQQPLFFNNLLQRVSESNEPLNLLEVVMARGEWEVDTQCPASHPYAFNEGKKCCDSKKFLHFSSTECMGSFKACSFTDHPCLNYNYMNYGCYIENVDLSTTLDLGMKTTETAIECEEHARSVDGASGFIWTKSSFSSPRICIPKADAKITPGPSGLRSWTGLFECL